MPQVLARNGDIISVLGVSSDCPSCGSAREEDECAVCGWTPPVRDETPEPRRETPKPPPKPTKRPTQSVVDHIDVHEVVCTVCGGDRSEIGGVLQCPTCGPASGMELPEEISSTPNLPRVLPDIDDQLPGDPRCPKCLEQAEAGAKTYGENSIETAQIGEREIQVDYFNAGAVALVCPLCNFTEPLAPRTAPVARKAMDATSEAIAKVDAVKETAIQSPATSEAERPILEVRRRKKG